MKKQSAKKVIVILGPTATGKSSLAIQLAKYLSNLSRINSKRFSNPSRMNPNKSRIKNSRNIRAHSEKIRETAAEIISADSRQIYKGLDIGTEKITKKEMKGVKHYMIDIVQPQKIYTVSQYQKTAKKILNQIFKKRRVPIIVGGSGFYIDALIYDYELPAVAPQKDLRKKLEKKSTEKLFQILQDLDPKRAANIDPYNRRRLVRALEIVIKTGTPVPEIKKQSPYQVLKIGIKKTPNELRQLINQRLRKTLEKGLIEETEKLHKKGLSWKRLGELGLEYRLATNYLRGLISYEEMTEQMKKEIYRYAKRQMTWFKRDKNIHWVKNPKDARNLIKKHLLL